jgi:hypothetical protein
VFTEPRPKYLESVVLRATVTVMYTGPIECVMVLFVVVTPSVAVEGAAVVVVVSAAVVVAVAVVVVSPSVLRAGSVESVPSSTSIWPPKNCEFSEL